MRRPTEQQMILELGEELKEISMQTALEKNKECVIVIHSNEAHDTIKKLGIKYDGEIEMDTIGFNKVETQQDCIVGWLYIPQISEGTEQRVRIQFFMNEKCILMLDDGQFAEELIQKIVTGKSHQRESKTLFLFHFITEFLKKDLEILGQYERVIMRLEESLTEGKKDCHSELSSIRKRLLILRGYYGEIADMGKVLEDNENDLFSKKELKYFGIISDRADRLMGKAVHLLEYAEQVKEEYQAYEDSRQSANMKFLTVMSTIFFPLTLITGWYGMNFQNMPELKQGYPGVIVLSLMVVLICIILFKHKRIF